MDNSDKKKPQGESKPAPASDETARPSMDKKAKEGAVVLAARCGPSTPTHQQLPSPGAHREVMTSIFWREAGCSGMYGGSPPSPLNSVLVLRKICGRGVNLGTNQLASWKIPGVRKCPAFDPPQP